MITFKQTKGLALAFLGGIFAIKATAQTQPYSVLDNTHPVSPSAWQFVKYTELPVSEYTGMPNISIPLYTIEEDGVKVPLDLTYHAGGIRVNEDASWVGLGWDLQVGSIVQQVNDIDDFSATTRERPDFYSTSQPIEFPYKYMYCYNSPACSYGCSGPLSINPVTRNEGFLIYTQYIAPFNGDYPSSTVSGNDFFGGYHYVDGIDSEPDIFTANFMGHSIKFVLDWATNNIVVLNKKGYQVTRAGDIFKILVPSGEEYDFALKNTIQSQSASDNLTGGTTGSDWQPSSIIWMLTKIVTKNHQTITFNYNVPTQTYDCFPTATDKRLIVSLVNSAPPGVDPVSYCLTGFVNNGISTVTLHTQSTSRENYITLSSITFPNGEVDFSTDNNRSDLMAGSKLNGITVLNTSSQAIKSYTFNYDYFDAYTVGGNTFSVGTTYGSTGLYRLKLNSVLDNTTGGTYTFTYNSTLLPAKNSYAVDYWGFYNGQTSNTSLVPNASQFVSTSANIDKSALGNNGDNHSANINYAQADILQQIKYPTGGSVNFTYELNQFSNYWVPDFANSNNTISSGNGLRIKSVVHRDINNSQLGETDYSYGGGLAILPVSMFRTFSYTSIYPGNINTANSVVADLNYSVNEINMTGLFSASPFSSVNGVGYSTVTKTEVDNSGNPKGKEVSNYYNTVDLTFNSTVGGLSQIDATLPAYKDVTTFENGSLQSVYDYDSNNVLLKKVENTYSNVNSPIYYGARVFGYTSLVRWNNIAGTGVDQQVVIPQNMVGYYPIFDFETLLSTTTETDYYGTQSKVKTTTNSYDDYNQIESVSVVNSDQNTSSTSYSYPYSNPFTTNSVLLDMIAQNRLSDIVEMHKAVMPYSSSPHQVYSFKRNFKEVGSLIVPGDDNVDRYTPLNLTTTTTYDQYDSSNGNLLQYTDKGVSSSIIYDYGSNYVVATVKNATMSNAAYTSFEADGKGNWSYSGTPVSDATAPTGNKAYSLAAGTISIGNLDVTKTYVVSYWSKNGAQTVNGNTSPVQGVTLNGYTYYEHTVTSDSGGNLTVSGTGTIDELRLYPREAQMTTFTYQPLVGITSQSDPSGKISYYEYDASMRLMDVRDQNKNIIKAYCYNYAGQMSNNCLVPQSGQSQSPTAIYARIEYGTTPSFYGNNYWDGTYNELNDIEAEDIRIVFYSDAACTIPYILTADLSVNIEDDLDIWDDINGASASSGSNTYIVPAGNSSYSLGTLSIYNTLDLYDYNWNYVDAITTYTTFSVITGSGYTPEPSTTPNL